MILKYLKQLINKYKEMLGVATKTNVKIKIKRSTLKNRETD